MHTKFNFSILPATYKGLLKYPAIKNNITIDWAESNSVEIDTSNVKFQKKEFEISLLMHNKKLYRSFENFIRKQPYTDWYFPHLNFSYKLRLLAFTGYEEFGNKAEIRLLVSDDFPLKNMPLAEYSNNDSVDNDWILNGEKASKLGVYFLKGSQGIVQWQEYKQPLIIENSAQNGAVISSTKTLLRKARKLTLYGYMKRPQTDFISYWYSFLYFLHQPQANGTISNILQIENGTFYFYFEDCQITDFLKDDNGFLYCSFELKIVEFGKKFSKKLK